VGRAAYTHTRPIDGNCAIFTNLPHPGIYALGQLTRQASALTSESRQPLQPTGFYFWDNPMQLSFQSKLKLKAQKRWITTRRERADIRPTRPASRVTRSGPPTSGADESIREVGRAPYTHTRPIDGNSATFTNSPHPGIYALGQLTRQASALMRERGHAS